jgi:hypothetical protein
MSIDNVNEYETVPQNQLRAFGFFCASLRVAAWIAVASQPLRFNPI